jgi:hypothetical protein
MFAKLDKNIFSLNMGRNPSSAHQSAMACVAAIGLSRGIR